MLHSMLCIGPVCAAQVWICVDRSRRRSGEAQPSTDSTHFVMESLWMHNGGPCPATDSMHRERWPNSPYNTHPDYQVHSSFLPLYACSSPRLTPSRLQGYRTWSAPPLLPSCRSFFLVHLILYVSLPHNEGQRREKSTEMFCIESVPYPTTHQNKRLSALRHS